MMPMAGSAYTYTYVALGELLAWIVGWTLILEYTVVCSAVAVGWSGYAARRHPRRPAGRSPKLAGRDRPRVDWSTCRRS